MVHLAPTVVTLIGRSARGQRHVRTHAGKRILYEPGGVVGGIRS
jgi:hypothetical protein